MRDINISAAIIVDEAIEYNGLSFKQRLEKDGNSNKRSGEGSPKQGGNSKIFKP